MAARKENRSKSKHGAKEDRKKASISMNKKQKQILLVALAVIIVFTASFGVKIAQLKKENRELKQQEAELVKEKSKLTKELKNINNKDYIEEQARKKLRLLNRDEIMFIFEDGDDE